MAAYNEKTGTCMSKTNMHGENGKITSKTKRGFAKKQDALNYEKEVRRSKVEPVNTPMTFNDLFEEYMVNKQESIDPIINK